MVSKLMLRLLIGNVQDVESFMKAIGRKCEEVSGKFEVNLRVEEVANYEHFF